MEQTAHDVGQAFLPVRFVTPAPVGIARPLVPRETDKNVCPTTSHKFYPFCRCVSELRLAALDHGQSSASLTRPAVTGLFSM